MLIYRSGCLHKADLYIRSPENWSDLTAAVGGIAGCCFIEVYDEDAIPSGCECRRVGQECDHLRLQPGVRLLRRSIVCIVIDIWNNE